MRILNELQRGQKTPVPKRFSVIKSLNEASKSLRLLIASITFLASAFGKDWILLIVIASVITLYNIVRFRQMSNLFTTLFQDIAIKKTHGNKSRVFECLILKSIEKCFYSAKSGVERYLSPLSGNKTTIFLPAFSGRLAT